MDDISLAKRKFIDYINHLISNNKVSHTYLIEVDNYDTDLLYINLFIKMILLNKSSSQVENSDDKILKMIDKDTYPDLKIISSEGNFIKKNQLLELQNDFKNTSLLDGKKIYIIKEAEKLNVSSANTMLKFLEEPVDNVVAFLVTTNRYLIIDTILSRCQVLSLKETNEVTFEDDYYADLLKCILNPCNYYLNYQNLIEEYFEDKDMIKKSLMEIERIIIDYMRKRVNDDILINDDFLDLLSKSDDKYLLNVISIIEDEVSNLNFNLNIKIWLDSLFSKIINGGSAV